jgi:hypothetical protein
MMRPALALLALSVVMAAFGSTEASAFGLYRKDGIWIVQTRPGCYYFRGPRWDYAAAYYQSYRYRRGYGHRWKWKCCR